MSIFRTSRTALRSLAAAGVFAGALTMTAGAALAGGQFIGMGRFRPRNNGYYGRFNVENFVAEEISMVKSAA